MSPIYDALGVSVGVLQNMQPYEDKQAAYAADVTYGTNSEFGFDYLRDNMATSLEEKVQHGGRPDPRTGSSATRRTRSPGRTPSRSSTRSTTSSSTRRARR